jgi:hypothetical protein
MSQASSYPLDVVADLSFSLYHHKEESTLSLRSTYDVHQSSTSRDTTSGSGRAVRFGPTDLPPLNHQLERVPAFRVDDFPKGDSEKEVELESQISRGGAI